MKNRRKFLTVLTTGFVALSVVVGSALGRRADRRPDQGRHRGQEGHRRREADTDKEVLVTVTDETEYVTKKGSSKIDLEKVSTNLKKAQDAGKKGINVTVTHEKASLRRSTGSRRRRTPRRTSPRPTERKRDVGQTTTRPDPRPGGPGLISKKR